MFKVFFFLNLMLTFWCFGGFWPIFAKETYTWAFWTGAGAGREGVPPLSTLRVHQGIGLPCAPFESVHRKIWIRAFFYFWCSLLFGGGGILTNKNNAEIMFKICFLSLLVFTFFGGRGDFDQQKQCRNHVQSMFFFYFWCSIFGVILGFWPIFAKETYTWAFWTAAGAGREGAPPLSTPRVHQGIGLPCAPFESGHLKIWIGAIWQGGRYNIKIENNASTD